MILSLIVLHISVPCTFPFAVWGQFEMVKY